MIQSKKTVLMVFNKDIKRDQLSIEQTKYLGFILDSKYTDEHHLVKGKQGAFASLSKLNFLGINTNYLCPFMKGQLFKIFIRPTLYYGMENVYLHKYKLNQIKRLDGNILKKIFMVPTRCRSTSLKLALNITPVNEHIALIKLEFYRRLMKNRYTNLIIEETKSITLEKDLKSEIFKLLEYYDDPLLQSQLSLSERIEAVRYIIKANINAEKTCNDEYENVKEVLHFKNREEIPTKLFDLIKFKF
ncbi:hypothetical protein BpHYR1_020053 [Brachionus plicatilis]|uniref:RNA-directed DNA polymerase from mobile element jockey-like n=1 Tax=Brachionus plicatilis TaxID=10195 RepID=A0A3M7QXM3_BRAPC|nr:hypothetical protein BpHYR1_020053 [Brachionus plicatilis]